MSSDPFTQVTVALQNILKSDQELMTLVKRANIFVVDDALHRKSEWLPSDFPALQVSAAQERSQVIRSSRASRFHLKYPISIWVDRGAMNASGQMNLLRWRILTLMLAAGPGLGLEHVVRVSPGQWVTGPISGKKNQVPRAAAGCWCESLMLEVDLWVSHRDENLLI